MDPIPAFSICKIAYDAVIFDLDGVVTNTAKAHASTWKNMFDEYLRELSTRESKHLPPFELATDYLKYVDGKPRYEGVKGFLESRKIIIPYGNPDDTTDKETVCGLGNKKNELFQRYLKEHGVDVYPSSIQLIDKLRSMEFKTAVVSSSKNCSVVLEVANIRNLFTVKIDGTDAARLGLTGKPNPDAFIKAASELDVKPSRAVVVEDAISGVQAGRRGNFGCVIGVDRFGQANALKENGADIVVNDLAEIAVE